jgi:transaldolase
MSLSRISAAGTSIWLDDLSRERMIKGGKSTYLPDLIENDFVVGVTTNPAIFSSAISGSDLYSDEISKLSAAGATADEIITELTTSDVRNACDIFAPIYERSGGVDGRVSIEVDPRLALDTAGTISQARELWKRVDRPNLLIKVPATREGIPAVRTLISEGISVNVTIIFSVSRYEEVLDAFIAGLEDRVTQGLSVAGIHSVASFFVSRVDTEIDGRLKDTPHESLRGRAALANARLAYKSFTTVKSSSRWASLSAQGAAIQRPLWASTGVKDPNYDPTMYVIDLIAPETVNTMPEGTLKSVKESARFEGDTITGNYETSESLLAELSGIGIQIEEVADKLEREGIDKFIKPWLELIAAVEGKRK